MNTELAKKLIGTWKALHALMKESYMTFFFWGEKGKELGS